ncbi:zinc finger, HIT-type protein [Rhodotorula toruloides]|uniref:Zinc finger, HIT-type protein n=1 Tax=Rhodotorula toruloides TaxID=5286 RepID=A0A511KLH0_RHOTO|nr:zinc finger, HIT-type protein [Rhodotorula toruloides]
MLATTKKDRRQPARAANPSAVIADSEYVARRAKRHLNDLERTNYTEPTTGPSAYGDADDESKGPTALGKDDDGSGKKRKRSMAIRSLLMYRKNLAALLDESLSPFPLRIVPFVPNYFAGRRTSPKPRPISPTTSPLPHLPHDTHPPRSVPSAGILASTRA